MAESNQRMQHLGAWAAIIATALMVLAFFGIQSIKDLGNRPLPSSTTPTPPDTDPPPSTVPSTSQEPNSSKAKYIRAADNVCLKWFRETGALEATPTDGSISADVQRVRQFALISDSMLTEWEALNPPPSDEDEVESILRAGREDVAAGEQAANELEVGNVEAARQLMRQAEQDDEATRRRARRYGFRVCH